MRQAAVVGWKLPALPAVLALLLAAASSSSELPQLTEDELEMFDGSSADTPLYVAVGGTVFDVSDGRRFYGPPDGPYQAFAGRACTRGLALSSLAPEDISDDISDFTVEQRASAETWTAFFADKYPAVALLAPDTPAQRAARQAKHQARRIEEQERREQVVKDKATARAGTTVTMAELSAHDGTGTGPDGGRIWLAVGGHVLDVTASAYLYGPGKPRHAYAGRVVTRALAANSVAAADIDAGSDLTGLGRDELARLDSRLTHFLAKFDKVGVLADAPLLSPTRSASSTEL